MKSSIALIGACSVAAAFVVSVGTLYVAPTSVLADADTPASMISPIYQKYFDSIRDDTLANWDLVTSSVSIYDYNFQTCSFDARFSIPYHWSYELGVDYLFRFCTDASNTLCLYSHAVSVGSWQVYRADFSLIWLVESSSSSDSSGSSLLNCYVNYWDNVFYKVSPSIYYSFTPTGTFSYVDTSYVSSLSPSLLYSSSDISITYTPAISVVGRWASPLDNSDDPYGDYDDGYAAGNSEGYASGYSDGYSAGDSAGNSEGYASGYSVGDSAGYSSGYRAGYDAGAATTGNVTMIDIWPLLSAVVTMPFTFIQNGLDWNLFSGTPYEFSVNGFFGTLLVLLILWKVISLIIGIVK